MLRLLGCGVLALVGLVALVLVGGYFVMKRGDIPYETLAAEYENSASRYQELPGGLIVHYRDEGVQTPGAPTLLLIHGFSASLHTWEEWRAILGDEFRIVSLDLPGHGLTRAPAGYQASVDGFSDVVAAFVQARGLSRFTLAGSSMGGHVAWQYALAHPDQVQGLILVDAAGWPDPRLDDENTPAVFRLLRNPITRPLLRDLDNTRLIREGLRRSFYDPALVDDEMVARYSELSRAPGHRDILLQLGGNQRTLATPERLAPLAQMPVLIQHGDSDQLVPVEHARLFEQAISGSQLAIYENTGHIPQEEIPRRSADDVRAFVRQVNAGAEVATVAQ